jgi:hypothetical protein
MISLTSINQMILAMEACCVFFEVGTEFLNIYSFKMLTVYQQRFCGTPRTPHFLGNDHWN